MYNQKLSLRDQLAKNYINAVGWRTKRKLVLIESDDWGTVRIESRQTYESLLASTGITGCFFDKYDAVESGKDLEMLFDVLSSVKDKNNHPAVMTPISVVANPNFEEVERNGFTEYSYESVLDTYKRIPQTQNSFEVANEGIHNGVWYPQFHGREHINYLRWLRALQMKDKLSLKAFKYHSLHSGLMLRKLDYFKAFDYDSLNDKQQLEEVMRDGLALFEKIWGYKAIAFCAPCSVISKETVDVASKNGIRLSAGQFLTPDEKGSYKRIDQKWGDKGVDGMRYYRRNCKFEPARDHNIDWVDRCLAEINIAFRWGKPANIDSHRVNYIGSIYEENRDYSLREMKRLLGEIVKLWPDVEFINSEQLYSIMVSDK